jgi:pantoate--beta-alanine ligase
MRIVSDPGALDHLVREARAEGRRIGFVPTMGYLHAGHRSLMALLRPRCDLLVASIYVNELQFAPGEDFDVYPRDPEGDAAACRAEGVDLLFMPERLYPPGFATRVHLPALDDDKLCSRSRPHFFTGVATVVCRLLHQTRCHVAAFGEKDFQQLTIVRRMVRDLAMDVEIVGGPIVREPDGLAMSSRNAYLRGPERARAASLSRALFAVRDAVADGETDAASLVALGRAELDVDEVDYFDIVDIDTLEPVTVVDRERRAAAAARVGRSRLIDNVALRPPGAR